DGLGLLLAAVFGLPTLFYPFGRDQALFAYVGEGWLQGFWPYADAVEHKPPAIFIVYALSSLIPVDPQVGARIVDLLLVLGAAPLPGAIARDRGERRDGDGGAAAVLLAGLYFTCLDYWDTAMVELWEGVAWMGAWWMLRRRGPPWESAVAGALF